MHWLIEFHKEVKKATTEQLKLWICYMKLFKDDEISIDRKKRDTYREIIYREMKIRGIRRDRSKERGKGKKQRRKNAI